VCRSGTVGRRALEGAGACSVASAPRRPVGAWPSGAPSATPGCTEGTQRARHRGTAGWPSVLACRGVSCAARPEGPQTASVTVPHGIWQPGPQLGARASPASARGTPSRRPPEGLGGGRAFRLD
jgi:hypothetical protein